MIVKSYSKDDIEIFVTQNEKKLFNVVRSVKGNESSFVSDLDYEDAIDTFDYFLDLETALSELKNED